eukprot:gene43212-57116_t
MTVPDAVRIWELQRLDLDWTTGRRLRQHGQACPPYWQPSAADTRRWEPYAAPEADVARWPLLPRWLDQ